MPEAEHENDLHIGKTGLLVLGFLVLLAILSVIAVKEGARNREQLSVYFLDVGQGDAVLIETPSGRQILIDGGPDNAVLSQLGRAMPFFDRSIDVVILTHPDLDHVAGLIDVLDRYKIENIIETGVKCDKPVCSAWQTAVVEEKSQVIYPSFGYKMILDNEVILSFLYPFEEMAGKKIPDLNNSSLVVRVDYNGRSILLTGDIEKNIEAKLIAAGIDLDTDFIKIAHHGSKTSSTKEFLEAVSPEAAFIGVGRNSFGHPSDIVIDRLEELNIEYYRTDTNGLIKLILDENNYYVETKK